MSGVASRLRSLVDHEALQATRTLHPGRGNQAELLGKHPHRANVRNGSGKQALDADGFLRRKNSGSHRI
jgi:hypothetical protein